jgi:alpha-glucosidase
MSLNSVRKGRCEYRVVGERTQASAPASVFRLWQAGFLLLITHVAPAAAGDAPPIAVRSPNGDVCIELLFEGQAGSEDAPAYRVSFHDKPIVLASHLGMELVGQPALGGPSVLESVQTSSRHNEYTMYPGKRRRVVDRCSEALVSLRERTPPGRRWQIELRAYDDGVAFRYRLPAQEGWRQLVLADERTEFHLPDDARGWALPLNSFTTSYEGRYQTRPIADFPENWLLGLPLLVECPGRAWLAITEARLVDHAGLYLTRAKGGQAAFTSRLSPLPSEPRVAVKADLPHDCPWRVFLVGRDIGRLIESDLILNLNDSCALADTSWIRTGKTTFPWWNGYYLEQVSFRPGLNTATMKHYIDFCSEAGIPYHSLDGLGDTAWYGGHIVPYEGADITRGLPGLDLQELLAYARQKGVRLRLWMHWQAARAHMDRAFPLYRKWGIEGVMVDFMDRDDQEMVRFVHGLVRKAAENRLTVVLHGTPKPTGLERTYPNLLTSEGVLNLEYDKWDPLGCPPEHQVTVACTRMLAGPLDFHQGSFRGVPVEQFKPRNLAPEVMGTPSRTLASYVVYQNHLSMVADYPSAYRGHPALSMLARIPTTWDDTRVLAASVGEYVVIARRTGSDWYIGAMNDRRARSLRVGLNFLGAGRYQAEIYSDKPDASGPLALQQSKEMHGRGDTVSIVLAPAGGLLMRLTRDGGVERLRDLP